MRIAPMGGRVALGYIAEGSRLRCYGKFLDAAPLNKQLLIHPPAFVKLGKQTLCLAGTAVDLPTAGALVIGASVLNKAQYISQRVPQKNPNFMRELGAGSQPAAQLMQNVFRFQLGVPLLAQEICHTGSCQVPGKPGGPVNIHQCGVLPQAQQFHPDALALEHLVPLLQLLHTGSGAGEQIGGFDVGQSGGTVFD